MAEGGLTGAPRRKKLADARLLDVPVVQHHGMKAPTHQLILDEMRVNAWRSLTVTQLRKTLGWQENTVQRALLNNTAFFEIGEHGWFATTHGKDAWATWKQQIYSSKGVTL